MSALACMTKRAGRILGRFPIGFVSVRSPVNQLCPIGLPRILHGKLHGGGAPTFSALLKRLSEDLMLEGKTGDGTSHA
jgi:hypothetical protein